jgi:hypothetical protein
MADPVMLICSLTGCTEEEATNAYDRTHDTVEAIDLIMAKPVVVEATLPRRRKREDITVEEEEVEKIRETLVTFDNEMDKKLSTGSRLAASVSGATPSLPEETVQQNNCLPEYHPASTE